MTTTADRWNWLVQHAVCTRPAQPGEDLSGRCPSCGHATVIHVGIDACPVCELRGELFDLRNTANGTKRNRED